MEIVLSWVNSVLTKGYLIIQICIYIYKNNRHIFFHKGIPLECNGAQCAARGRWWAEAWLSDGLLLLDSFLTAEDGVLALHLGPRHGAVGQVSDQPRELCHLGIESTVHRDSMTGRLGLKIPNTRCRAGRIIDLESRSRYMFCRSRSISLRVFSRSG